MASSKTVLVIEDDSDTRFVLSAILNHDGYHVIEAVDGEKGVALASGHLPDAIIMDLHLPRMNGGDAAAALGGHEQTRDIPVVAISGDWEALGKPSVAALFHSSLAKPFEPGEVRDRIRGIIGDP